MAKLYEDEVSEDDEYIRLKFFFVLPEIFQAAGIPVHRVVNNY
jgi:hypothetical protein